MAVLWAHSSAGRAFGSHPRGRGFESLWVHQVYLPKMMQVRKNPGIPGFFRVLSAKKAPSQRDVFE